MRLHHVQVACARGSEDTARLFYGAGLGLTEVDKPEDLKPKGGVWFRDYDETGTVSAEIHIGVDDPFAPALKAHPAFQFSNVAELEAVAAQLNALGFDIDWTQRYNFPGNERFHTSDGQGNRVEFLAPLEVN